MRPALEQRGTSAWPHHEGSMVTGHEEVLLMGSSQCHCQAGKGHLHCPSVWALAALTRPRARTDCPKLCAEQVTLARGDGDGAPGQTGHCSGCAVRCRARSRLGRTPLDPTMQLVTLAEGVTSPGQGTASCRQHIGSRHRQQQRRSQSILSACV